MNRTVKATLAIVAAEAVMAGGVLLAGAVGITGRAYASSTIQGDDPAWDCTTMGNRVCGPTNTQHVPAGLYRDGQLIAAWDPAWYGHPELVPDVTYCPADGTWSAQFHACVWIDTTTGEAYYSPEDVPN